MTADHIYPPADERALYDLWRSAVEEAKALAPGRHIEVVISRQKNGRITGHIETRIYPLEDS